MKNTNFCKFISTIHPTLFRSFLCSKHADSLNLFSQPSPSFQCRSQLVNPSPLPHKVGMVSSARSTLKPAESVSSAPKVDALFLHPAHLVPFHVQSIQPWLWQNASLRS